jgi:hypothetical protein
MPSIVVCHGFGGIIVKRALVYSSTSRAKMVEHRVASLAKSPIRPSYAEFLPKRDTPPKNITRYKSMQNNTTIMKELVVCLCVHDGYGYGGGT